MVEIKNFVVNGECFNYWIDDSYYKSDIFGRSGGRKFKKFFIEFSKKCFELNSKIALFKGFSDFPLANSERNSYASIATAGNSIEGYHIISEYCVYIEKKTPKDEEEKVNIKNNIEHRFLDFFLVGENGFNVAIEVKNVWQNIKSTREEPVKYCKNLINECIKQTITHTKNRIKEQFLESEQLSNTLCVALIISPIFFNLKDGYQSKDFKKELNAAKEKRKEAINKINNYIVKESEKQLCRCTTIKKGLISSVLDCQALFDKGYTHWIDGVLTDLYIGALVLQKQK